MILIILGKAMDPNTIISRSEQKNLYIAAQNNSELKAIYNNSIEDGKFTIKERRLFLQKSDEILDSPIQ